MPGVRAGGAGCPAPRLPPGCLRPAPDQLAAPPSVLQACEHGLKTYKAQLEPFKKSLPKGILRDFKC